MTENNLHELIKYRISKAKETLSEVDILVQNK
jgi:hypothetical protein